jgi:tetratricopeptide (TPR) repeat protein
MFGRGDLVDVHPLLGTSHPPLGKAYVEFIRENMPALVELRSDFFAEGGNDDDVAVVPPHLRTLAPRAARDAVFRMPHDLLHHYLRALRLEERYEVANAACRALLDYVDRTNVVVGNKDDARSITDRLRVEYDKLERTTKLKDEANALFRDGKHDRALVLYGNVLSIDADDGGRRAGPVRSILRQSSKSVTTTSAVAKTAGGKLHAVLHSNRSACLLAIGKHDEAIRESSYAIEIHPTYMKAMSRRAKCYAMVGQLELARADYGRYVSLVEVAMRQRGSGHPRQYQGSACHFDVPSNVSMSQLEAVKREMNSLVGERPPATEIKARKMMDTRGIKRTGKERRRKLWWKKPSGWWCCKNDVRSQVVAHSSHQPPSTNDDQRRRKVTFSAPSVSSIPPHWIPPPQSFPPKRPNDNTNPTLANTRPAFDRPLDPPSAIDPGVDYYAVLGLTLDASEPDIKRAYHTLAKMYHPDRNKSEDSIALFQDISLAHTILSDTKGKKREYDNSRKGLLDP